MLSENNWGEVVVTAMNEKFLGYKTVYFLTPLRLFPFFSQHLHLLSVLSPHHPLQLFAHTQKLLADCLLILSVYNLPIAHILLSLLHLCHHQTSSS